MSALLRYPPGLEAGSRPYPVWVPVDTYMDKEGYKELEAHGLRVGFTCDSLGSCWAFASAGRILPILV